MASHLLECNIDFCSAQSKGGSTIHFVSYLRFLGKWMEGEILSVQMIGGLNLLKGLIVIWIKNN